MQSAAELIGKVSTIPTITEIIIPIQNGCKVVASMMVSPSPLIRLFITGPKNVPILTPDIMVTAGVIIISILVSFETTFPSSTLNQAAIQAPAGPPN